MKIMMFERWEREVSVAFSMFFVYFVLFLVINMLPKKEERKKTMKERSETK